MFNDKSKIPAITTEVRVKPLNSSSPKRLLLIITIAAAVVILALGALFWRSQSQLKEAQQTLEQQRNDPAFKQKQENQELIAKVGKLIILPGDEEPTIATVTDLSKLQGQAFFAKAALGDKVLIYSKASKAILYRPSSNQIIELAPLLTGTNTPAAPQSSSPQPTPAQ